MAGLSALPSGLAAGAGVRGDVGDSSTEPADTRIRSIDGTNVVFQYGRPVPSFDTWRQDNPDRSYEDLNGEWRFRFGRDGKEPEEIGIKNQWYEPEHDDSEWRTVDVPQPWDLYDTPGFDTYDGSNYGEGTAFRDGYGWYRKRVRIDESWNQSYVKLNFLAAFYSARVYVNGSLIGEHEGGHTPFSLDISDELRPGEENVIAVRVYRRPWMDDYTAEDPTKISGDNEVPPGVVDWWPYAGLTRGVYMEATDQVTVSKLLVDAADGKASMRAVVYNHGEKEAKRLLRFDPGSDTGGDPVDKQISIEGREVRVVEATTTIPDAEPWSVDSPTTYDARVTLYQGVGEGQAGKNGNASIRDTLSARYGVRTVSVENAKLKINGEPVFLKGYNWHEETGANGRSLTLDEYDTYFERVEQSNANFIRNHAYNRHPYVYEYADEHGLFVMDEVENMWLPPEQQKAQLEYGLSRALVATMAWNQYNSPSTILWSVQNESSRSGGYYREWLADMKEAVKAVDSRQDRPVTWGSGSTWDHAYDLADVLGNNEYFGFFYMENDDLGPALDAMHENHPEKPIVITENGTWSIPSQRGEDVPDDEWDSVAWQANNFEAHWKQVIADERSDFMAGYTFWLLKDYKQRDTYNRFSANGVSTMGTINWGDPDFTTYEVFDVIRDAYGDLDP